MEIRDLETLGSLVAPSLRSDATAQGPRVSKSRISMDSPYNLHVYIETRQIQATTPEDNSFFPKRKSRAVSGGTRTHDVLRSRKTCTL